MSISTHNYNYLQIKNWSVEDYRPESRHIQQINTYGVWMSIPPYGPSHRTVIISEVANGTLEKTVKQYNYLI